MTIMPKLIAGLMASTFIAGSAIAAGTHPITGDALADDQTFTYRVLDDILTVDPSMLEDVSSSSIARDLFEGLYSQDNDGNLVPAVALSHDVNDAGDVYTFHLRAEAVWSNGDPVVAGDFVYSWQRLLDPATASAYSWFGEVMGLENASEVLSGDLPPSALGVSAIDDHTLEVRLATPLSYFALTTTQSSTFPIHRATVEAHGDQWTQPENIVSNGAYILTEYLPSERVTRERNPMYWDNASTIIEKTTTLIINDENVALTRYFAGELDRTEVPAGQYPKLSAEYPNQAISFPRLCSYYYVVNMTEAAPEALKDVRVRKALSLAVDRDILVDKVLAGGQTAAYTFTPSSTAGFTVPDMAIASMTQAERDAEAKALLSDAGYGPENPLTFDMIYNTSEGHKKIAIAMSQMWKQKLGAEVTLANQEWKTFLETRGNQDFHLARGAWCGDYNEASTFLDLVQSASGYNDGKFNSSRVDELLTEAKTSDNPQPLYTEVEQIIDAEVPLIPVYFYAGVYMMDSDLANWPVSNVQQRWYSKNLYKTAE